MDNKDNEVWTGQDKDSFEILIGCFVFVFALIFLLFCVWGLFNFDSVLNFIKSWRKY